MKNSILFGSIVTSDSPKGSFDFRNLINVIFTGLIACIPVFILSVSTQVETLDFGNYTWALPIVLMVLKAIAETFSGKKV